MTTINNFSPARFWSVTTRDAALNWKTHLAHLLELAGTLLAGLLIIIITAKTHESTSFVSIADILLVCTRADNGRNDCCLHRA